MAKAKPETKEPEVLIDLDELTEPAGFLKFGKKRYDFKPWDLFNLLEQKQIARDWARVSALEEAADITDEEAEEYGTLAREILQRVCAVPDVVVAKMSTTQMIEGAAGFFGVQQARQKARPILLLEMARKGLLRMSAPLASGSTPTSGKASNIG